MRELSRTARAYVFVVAALAAAVVVAAAFIGAPSLTAYRLLDATVVLSLILLTTRLRVETAIVAPIDLGLVMTLAAPMILGPAPAVLVIALGKALSPAKGTPLIKWVFNTAAVTLAAASGAAVYSLGCTLGGVQAVLRYGAFQLLVLPAFGCAAVVVCVINALLVANIVHLAQGVPRREVLSGAVMQQAVAYLGYGLFGLLLGVLWRSVAIGPVAALLVLVPIFVARWVFQLYVAEKQAYESTVRALVRAVETKDLYTRQHGERVSKAAVMIARRGGMRQDRLEMLRYAGFLHDVGKLGVPTRVLQKNGRLSDAEFDAVALHPLHGFEIVSGIEFLGEAHEGIRHHHERLDGRGYPSGLKGEEIPEFARILAVADAFDAMTSTRSYRGARPVAEALLELERCKGTQFQPEFVDLLSAAVGEEGWELADSLPPLHVVDTPVIPAQGGARCHDEPAASHDGSAA